jgi:hypothetical protein
VVPARDERGVSRSNVAAAAVEKAMTEDELQAIEARHRHDHAEDGGAACPSCEADVPALIAEVRRLQQMIKPVTIEFVGFGGLDGAYGPGKTSE